MEKIQKLGKILMIDSPRELVMRLFSSWILAAFFLVIDTQYFINLDFCEQTDFKRYLIYIMVAFIVFSFIRITCTKINDDILLLGVTMLYAVKVLRESTDVYLLFGVCFFCAMVFLYCYPNIKGYTYSVSMSNKKLWCMVGIIFALTTGFVGAVTIVRYLSACSSNFDMGIFVQTFYNLKEHFTLDNTCERNEALSHLQVHVSLFFYLLAPVYWLFPKAQTLLVLQAMSVSTAVIPLLLLAKKKGLSNKTLTGLGCVYLLSVAAWGGCFYDFHENVFLLPLLLWCFYCYEAGYTKLMFLFAFLTCTVKEDAPLFILVFGAYLLLCKGKKDIKKAIALLVLAAGYMGGAFYYLTKYGLGLMSHRYSNLMYNDSLFSIIQVILTNPAYLFTQIFNTEKLEFIILVFLPLAGMVFMTKKYQHLILLIPLLFINLLPEYTYMHSVFYQYVFAPMAFVMYLCVINLTQMKDEKRKKILCVAAIFSLLTFISQIYPKKGYLDGFKTNEETRNNIIEAFETIPEEASVTANTFYVPQLASREEIYMLDDSEIESGVFYDTDYIVFDLRPGFTMDNLDSAINTYKERGYEEAYRVESAVLLLKQSTN